MNGQSCPVGTDDQQDACVSEEYCFSEVNDMTNFTECFQLWRSRTACWIANNHSSWSSSDSHAMYNTNFLFLTSSYNVFGLLFLFLAQIHFLLMHRHNRRGGGLPSRFHNLSIGNRLLSYKSPVKPLCPPPRFECFPILLYWCILQNVRLCVIASDVQHKL